jgi:hypothetical protein
MGDPLKEMDAAIAGYYPPSNPFIGQQLSPDELAALQAAAPMAPPPEAPGPAAPIPAPVSPAVGSG